MLRFSQFFKNLTSKQLYGLLAGIILLIFLLIFGVSRVFASRRNNNSQSQANFSIDSATNSQTQTNSASSNNFSSASSLTANSSTSSAQNSLSSSDSSKNSNSVSTTSSAKNSAEPNSANSQNQTNPQNPELTNLGAEKFVGQIGDLPIEMYFDKEGNYFTNGSYFYTSQGKKIDLKYKNSGSTGVLVWEEFVGEEKTGYFQADAPAGQDMTQGFKGTWTNAKTGEKLGFWVKNVKNSATNEQKTTLATEMILTDECRQILAELPDSFKSAAHEYSKLPDGGKIIRQRCALGAYQNYYNFNYLNEQTGEVKLLEFPWFHLDSQSLRSSADLCLRSEKWQPEEQTFIARCSSRGIGDCGSENTYKWLPEEKNFELILSRQQNECFLNKPGGGDMTQEEIEKNLKFPIVYQK